LLAAAVAGTMPAITLIHLECFLSQALGTPFLLAWPMMLATASQPQSGDPRKTITGCLFGGLTAAAGWSIYTEYLPLYLAAWLVFIVAEFARRRWQTPSQPIPSFLWTVGTSIITIVLGFMLNPFYLPNIISFFLARPGLIPFGPENVLDSVYPWSGKIAGITHLWFGSLTIAPGPLLRSIDAMALLLFGLGIGSLVALSIRTKKSLGAVASALLAAPWVIGFGWKFGYIHYKALSSVSPLVPVGLACFEHSAWRAWPPVARFGSVWGRFALLMALAFSLAGTLNLTFRAGGGAGLTMQAMGRGGSFKLVDPAMRDVQHRLETRKGQTIYIAWFDDFFGGNFVNAWLVYFSRFNTVYAVNPRVNDARFDLTMHDPSSEFVVVASSQYPEFEQYLRSGDSPFHIYELPREAWPAMRQKFVTQLPGPKALVDTLR